MRAALLALCLLAFAPAAAQGQAGINLDWNDCDAGGGRMELAFACDSSVGAPFIAILSVVVPADMPQFVAASTTVDLCFIGGALPPWWQTLAGQCRQNAISMSFDPLGNPSACPDIWQGTPVMQVFQPLQDYFGPGQLRLQGGAAIAPGSGVAVPADGTELYLGRIAITRDHTTGTDACSGCSTTASIAFSRCTLQQPAGIGDYTLTQAARSNLIFWNRGVYPDPCNVPAVNRTWGAVKSLYR